MSAASPTRPSRRATQRRKIIVDDEHNSDVENIAVAHVTDEDEEEFTPAAKSARKSPRRRTNAAAAAGAAAKPRSTAQASGRTQDANSIQLSIEPSDVFDAPSDTVMEEPASPTRKSPAKRRSVKDARLARQSRGMRASLTTDATTTSALLPTPEASATPEARMRRGTPLGDITESSLNERTQIIPEPITPSAGSSFLDNTPKSVQLEMRGNDVESMEGVEATSENVPTPRAAPVNRVDPNVTKMDRPMDILIRTRALGIPQSQAPTTPKERLTISHLVLNNFKSYAGRKVVGPFHASFTSVVGPNGSGKSNVIDSLLFVFGFRANKMRQGKISALIHNSAQHPNLDSCEVEVHFQTVKDEPDGRATVEPNSQLVISRRAYKNNNSTYSINGKSSNFTQVTTLLKEKGVDLDHKRFLILQGEVESIAQMKPKAANEHDDGLLEYLEDIIGTSGYKASIEEAATQTEALNEVCAEKNGRVQHVEREKNSLEDKRNKAMAYIRDEDELTMKRSHYHQLQISQSLTKKDILEDNIHALEEELQAELERHQGAENEIKGLEKQYKIGAKEYQKMEQDTDDILKRVDNQDKATVKIGEKRKHLTNKNKKLEKALEGSRHGLHESETLAKQSDEDVRRIRSEIEDLEQERLAEEQQLVKIRESLRGKTQGVSDEIAAKQQQLEPWNAKINEKESEAAVAQSELDILRGRESEGARQVADVEAKIADLQERSIAKEAAMQNCMKQRDATQNEIESAHRKLDDVFRRLPELDSKRHGARQKADEARASLSASKNQGDVLTALTRLSDSGRIEGFHGRLGNLGAIDAKYDIAISTACRALDHIVVDTVEGGQQCIEYLRKQNLGRANFLVLNKIPQRAPPSIQTPEGCPRLFDLVKSKHPQYLPAFYKVLGDTLVAKDSAQADRVGYGKKRWRVVSLEGKLIEKEGVMSGGGSQVARGAMSSKVVANVTKEQVTKLEVDRDALEKEHADLDAKRIDLETIIKEKERAIPTFDTETQKLELERGSIQRNIADAQKRIQELSAGQRTAKTDKGKESMLEKKIAALQRESGQLRSETESIEADIQQLQDKLNEIGGVKLRSQKIKVDELRDQIESRNEELSVAEVAKTKATKQRTKHGRSIEDASEEIEKIARELEAVEREAQNQSKDTSGLRHESEQAKQALEFKKDELDELKKQLEELRTQLNETRGAEVEVRKRLDDEQKRLALSQRNLQEHEEKLSKLSLHGINEDGEEGEPQPLPVLSEDELRESTENELMEAIVKLEERTSHHVELSVIAEYRRRVNEYSSRLDDLNSALAERDAAKKRLDDLRNKRLEGFMQGFSIISARLKEMYQMITMGGNAELELVDSLDPFSEGILFSVMPPKKSWKNISNLSGGEKTLSSLALVFALHHYKPTPLYVMDEIDAALDFRNVSIVAAYIKERTKNAQFIVISLRNNMFELAARLVGVYKVNNNTKSVTIENKDYVNVANQPSGAIVRV